MFGKTFPAEPSVASWHDLADRPFNDPGIPRIVLKESFVDEEGPISTLTYYKVSDERIPRREEGYTYFLADGSSVNCSGYQNITSESVYVSQDLSWIASSQGNSYFGPVGNRNIPLYIPEPGTYFLYSAEGIPDELPVVKSPVVAAALRQDAGIGDAVMGWSGDPGTLVKISPNLLPPYTLGCHVVITMFSNYYGTYFNLAPYHTFEDIARAFELGYTPSLSIYGQSWSTSDGEIVSVEHIARPVSYAAAILERYPNTPEEDKLVFSSDSGVVTILSDGTVTMTEHTT